MPTKLAKFTLAGTFMGEGGRVQVLVKAGDGRLWLAWPDDDAPRRSRVPVAELGTAWADFDFRPTLPAGLRIEAGGRDVAAQVWPRLPAAVRAALALRGEGAG